MRGGRRNGWGQGRVIAVLAAAALVAAACGGEEAATAPTLPPSTTAAPGATAPPETAPETVAPTTAAPAAEQANAPAPGRLAGDAQPNLSGAEGGRLSVAQSGRYRQPSDAYAGSMPLVLVNGSSTVVVRAEVAATASGGGQEFSAEDWGFHPNVIAPGGFAIGMVYFGDSTQFPPGTSTTFGLSRFPESHYPFEIRFDLALEDVQRDGSRVSGVARNPTDKPLKELDVKAACFDTAGQILFVTVGNWSEDTVAPGGTSRFAVDFFGEDCPTYLVGAVGYSE